jgi:hypothetical protein
MASLYWVPDPDFMSFFFLKSVPPYMRARTGEPPVEAQEQTGEKTPVVEEKSEPDDEGGGIPGFPVTALVLGMLCLIIFILQRKR